MHLPFFFEGMLLYFLRKCVFYGDSVIIVSIAMLIEQKIVHMQFTGYLGHRFLQPNG